MSKAHIFKILYLIFFFALWGSYAFSEGPQAVEKMVNVGSYNLYFKIIPGEGPTILLESGGGDDSTVWSTLAPQLAQETGATVVAYDRAGFGKSGLPDTKYDLRRDTAEMWGALHKLGYDKDLILVGHSYGGFLIRFVASEYTDAVRGIVFVDPFTVEFVDIFGIEYCNNHPMMGKLPFDTSHPEQLNGLQLALVRMVGAPRSNLAEKCDIMRKTKLPEGIPVRVMTSGQNWLPNPEEQKGWRESHERLTALSKDGKLVIATQSDHLIPLREPELVVSTVAKIVQLANMTTN